MKRQRSSTLGGRRLALLRVVGLLAALLVGLPAGEAQPTLEAGAASSTLEAPAYGTSGLEVRWRLFRDADAGSEEETHAFEAVLTARAELGIPELPEMASVVANGAYAASASGDEARVERLLDWATTLAPSSAEPAFVRADLAWRDAPWNLPVLVSATAEAWAKAWASPLDRPVMALHLGLIVFWAVVALTLAFVLIQLARYARLASYDLASLTGHVVSRTWAWALLIAAVGLPAVLLQSPILLLILTLALPWAYQTRSEWIATLVLLATLGLSPLLLQHLGGVVAQGSSTVTTVYRAELGPCGALCRSQLDGRIEAIPADHYAELVAGAVRLRSGQPSDLEEALALLSPAAADGRLAGVSSVLLGKAQYLSGDEAGARAAWERALDVQSDGPVALASHFNLFRAALEAGHEDDARRHFEEANALDEAAVTELHEHGVRRVNRWLMSATVPAEVVRELAANGREQAAKTAAGELWAPVGGSLSTSGASLIAGLAFLMMLAGAALRPRLRAAALCPTCGAVMSARDSPDAAAAGYCPDCYTLFMAGASLETAERVQLERRVDGHRRRSLRFWFLGNVLAAGLGFAGRGNAWPGLPLLALVVLGVVTWTTAAPAEARSLALHPEAFDGRRIVAILCWLVAYLIAWTATWLRRPRRAR